MKKLLSFLLVIVSGIGLGYHFLVSVHSLVGVRTAFAAPVFFDTPPAPYPAVNFSYTPAQPLVTQYVNFKDTSSCYKGVDAVGNPLSGSCLAWVWNLGDGYSSSVQNPQHGYASAGTFTATVFVTDQAGNSCVSSSPVNVQTSIPGGSPTPTGKAPNYNEVPPK